MNWKLIEAKIENLEEETIGVSDSDILKVLDWLNDNLMLNSEGRMFNSAFYTECKRKGIKTSFRSYSTNKS